MLTRNQRYAAQVFAQVSQLLPQEHKKYGSMAHKLPVLIRTAGLAQALSFVEARGSDEQKELLNHLAAALGRQDGREGLLAHSRTAELGPYMCLTRNVLSALLWYKRFAQSVLRVEAGEEEQGSDSE